jgi:alpha-glucosidase
MGAYAQNPGGCSLGSLTQVDALPNGIALHAGQATEVITALRGNVLRVRVSPTGKLPEDSSWAVLESARQSSVPVEQVRRADAVGFRTPAMQVLAQRNNLMLTFLDAQGQVIQQDARPVCYIGKSFTIMRRMPADEHYFGLGDKTGPLDRRGQAFTMWNTDSYRFQESTDPLYKSIPFFMTFRAGTAVGVLLDNTWRSNFNFGRGIQNMYTFGAVNGPLNYYVFLGPAPRKVVETYAWLTGKPLLPPRWALGYQQSRYTYSPEARLLQVARRLRADRIPADALYLDIGFQYHNRPFTVNKKLFPDFPGMVKELHQMHFHLVTITDMHIAKAPDQGYAPYDSGMAKNVFVHNPDGSVFSGVVWPGLCVFPDFTQARVRRWWGTLYRGFVADGVDGFWNDMNEPSVFNTPSRTIPADAIDHIQEPGFAPRTATQAEIHNIYGMENSRATYDGLLRLRPNQRPFVLTRATFAGGQRYALTWTGDDSSTWNHLRLQSFMLENLGLSGFSFAGADVGGFAGTPPADLLTRWMEVAAFEPIDRDHTELGTGNQEPWVGGAAQEAIRRHFIDQRYRLMPYFYTVSEESSVTGLPMMRPIFLNFPDAAKDGHPIDIDPGAQGEFMVGGDLLIDDSPYPEEPDAYTVEFPTAVWYDYWTGKRVQGSPAPKPKPDDAGLGVPSSPASLVPLTLNVVPTLDTIPVFVRGGAIVPMQPLTQYTSETPQGPLTLRVYEGPDCRGHLYLDDGESFDYQHGDDLRMQFTCAQTPEGLQVKISPHEGTYPAWWKQIRLQVYGWTPKQNTAQDSAVSGRLPVQPDGNGFVATVPDNGKGMTITLK